MKYCPECGAPVVVRIPEGDVLPRHVCLRCGSIHYENPRLVVGCVPVFNGQILFCQRGIEPRRGYWTIPAGFLENGETLQQAAARECQEEALADVQVGSLLSIVEVIPAQQVNVIYRAQMRSPVHGPGAESLRTKLLHPEEIPWEDLAFASTRFALRRYLNDLESGSDKYHSETLRLEGPSPNVDESHGKGNGWLLGEVTICG